jgi:hypothetical protein
VNVEDDTREIPFGGPEDGRAGQSLPDLGPWGTEAVPLGKDERDQEPIISSTRRAEAKPHRWILLAAIACVTSLIVVLGVNILSGGSGPQTHGQEAAKTRRQPFAAELKINRTRAARRAEQRRRQVRRQALGSTRRSIPSPHPTHPAPSPTYAPAPEPAPPPEPVAPSRAPAPAPTATPTTKPPPASGPTVAKEFGFER